MSPILSRLSWAQGFGRRPYSAPPGSAIFNNIEDFFSTYLYWGASATVSHIQKFGGGSPIPSTDSPFTGTGEGYNSIQFGLSETIEITTSSEFDFGSNESFTVEWWEKRFPLNSSTPIEKDPYMTVMDIGNTSAGLHIALNGQNTGTYWVKIGNGGTTILTEGTGVAADSGWHHYAFTVESLGGNQQQCRFYRDGVEQASNTVNSITWGSSTDSWIVGGQKAYPASYNFQGRVSNFRVTKGICRYKANFSIPTKPFSDWADGANTYTLFVCCKSADILGADGAVFTNGAYTKKTRVKYLEKGGMVWIKSRGQAQQNTIVDTIRGRDKHIFPDANNSESTDQNNISAFTGDGFSVGNDSRVNNSSYYYASWSFARDPKFMDIVEYTGNGATSRYIDHALDNIPGFLMIKNLDQGNAGWVAIHRNAETQTATPGQGVCQLNTNHTTIWNLGDTPDAQYPSLGGPDNKTNQFHVTSNWNNYETSSGAGYLGTNNNGERYIAYIFAHDESADGMIRCGYFNTNGGGTSPVTGGNEAYNDIGWEPQWILTKEVCEDTTGFPGTTGDWLIWDDKRGVGKYARYLLANDNQHESGTSNLEMNFHARGFRVMNQANGRRFIYVAIRKGLLGNPKDTKRKAVDLFALAKGASSSSTYQGNNGGFVTNIVDSGSVEPPVGQTEYTTPGSYTWTVPANCTTIHIGMIGGGAGGGGGGGGGYSAAGGAGGGGAYANTVSVTPGENLTVDVGSGGNGGSGPQHPTAPGGNGTDSKVTNSSGVVLCHASGAVWQNNNRCDAGRMIVGDGGGLGGSDYTQSGQPPNNDSSRGGTTGGAGGNGNRMEGLDGNGNFAGGGGGYGTGGGGGGVAFSGSGVFTQTSVPNPSNSHNGAGTYDIINNNQVASPNYGTGRSGGTNGTAGSGGYWPNSGAGNGGNGGTYGGGGGGGRYGGVGGSGGGGMVRIIWGNGRSFPNSHGDQPTNTGTSTEVKTYGFAPDAGFVLQSYDASGGARECWARVGGTSNTGGPGGSSSYQTKWDLDGNQSQTDTQNIKWPMNGGNYGGNNLGNNDIIWTWRRAKGFFDSCYFGSTGNDNQPYPHNLGVVPEMIWQRRVSGNQTGMYVYHKDLPVTQYLETSAQSVATSSGLWGDGTVPHTKTHFTMGSVASSGHDNVAFLFATCPGLSKVGKYDTLANGDPQNIDCGFTTGARAIIIKKITNTSSSDGWFCFDKQRGIADATSGASSGSITFTGNVTDTLRVVDQGAFRFGNGPYTIEFWIKTTANAGWIMFNAAANNGFRLCIGNNGGTGSNSGKIEMNEQVANADEYTRSTTAINDGVWHHVACSRPDGGQVKIFIDGTHEATGNSSGRSINSMQDCYFGRRQSGGGWAFNGQLSNFRITNETLYTSNFTPPTSALAQTSDTKMLFMQSTTDPLASTVTPGTISYTGATMSASGDNPFSNAVTPYMRLDDTGVQVTGSNPWIKRTDTGFRIESGGGTEINVANETYIYYAIA